MVDYKTFKKEYLNEWVDRSQAARKAAEELANKGVVISLRERTTRIFDLAGHKVEFKAENETSTGNIFSGLITGREAIERFGKPDENGWRLPTREEIISLRDNVPYLFDKDIKSGVFGSDLILPADGFCQSGLQGGTRYRNGIVGSYWTSTYDGDNKDDYAWFMEVKATGVGVTVCSLDLSMSVRLLRDVKQNIK